MKPVSKADRKSRPKVVSRHGTYRFQTGMVTADLLRRGMPMKDAMDASREIRQRIAHRTQITTDELEEEIHAQLVAAGHTEPVPLTRHRDSVLVKSGDHHVTLPRHIVLRDLVAVGLDVEIGVELADDLEHRLRRLGPVVQESDVVDMLTRVLDETDPASARRYRLVSWLRTADRPVVVLLGGATGTGKSTLALELAFRLGIRMVVSTDMIRETMRTVLSSDIVPGLHDHSFRGMLQGGQVLSDPRERVLAGFRQQAAQVAVGVRAAIARAATEHTHMLLEGTHLMPPFAQLLPPDIEVYHAGLVLGVTNEGRHRARFPARASAQRRRDASAYLDAFQSVRWIHDDLLAAAEDADALVLDVDDSDRAVMTALDFLSHALPTESGRESAPVGTLVPDSNAPRTLVLVLDGLPDEPHPALDGRTPLAAADKPFLEMLAHSGGQGQIDVGTGSDALPHTDIGMWALLGAEPLEHRLGRGVFEAIGAGIPVAPGAVVLRGNLATRREGDEILDRRAGRIASGAEELVANLRNVHLSGGVIGNVFAGVEHRVVVTLHGPALSADVSDTDPGGSATVQEVKAPHPTVATPEAGRTATALRELLAHASRHLAAHPVNLGRIASGLAPANCIITRGAAMDTDRPPANPRLRHGAIVAGCSTALGVGRLAGLLGVRSAGMTGTLDTDLDAKFDATARLLRDRMVVVVHIKGTDVAAHDRRPIAKREFITRFDAALGRFLELYRDVTHGLRVVVSSDHGTSSRTGHHVAIPVPLLVGTWHGPTDRSAFDEQSAAGGALGVLAPGELSRMLWG